MAENSLEKTVSKGRDARGRGRPGGEESRARILAAACRLFADRGYEGVTVRAIARAARVNVAAVAYHFGGKRGLYGAVMDQLASNLRAFAAPAAGRLEAGIAAANGDRAALGGRADEFARAILAALVADESARGRSALMARELIHRGGAFDALMREAIDPLHDAVEALAVAAGAARVGREARLLAVAVIAQCLAFAAARPIVTARMGWPGFGPAAVAELGALLGRTIQRTLALPETGAPPHPAP